MWDAAAPGNIPQQMTASWSTDQRDILSLIFLANHLMQWKYLHYNAVQGSSSYIIIIDYASDKSIYPPLPQHVHSSMLLFLLQMSDMCTSTRILNTTTYIGKRMRLSVIRMNSFSIFYWFYVFLLFWFYYLTHTSYHWCYHM